MMNFPPISTLLKLKKLLMNFMRGMMQWHEVIYTKFHERRTAFGKRFVWWIKDPLDVVKMRQTAEMFIGLKDFQSFTADDPEEKSTKVHINSIDVQQAGDLILIRIVGSHFIWKMVRQIIGVLAEVGRGKMPLNDVKKFLHAKSDEPAKFTAPPSGLFLERVYYKGDVWLKEYETDDRYFHGQKSTLVQTKRNSGH